MNRSTLPFASLASAGMAGARMRTGAISRQAGASLIEVLVAVLVLSIGFLGIAALQVLSMSTNNSAMAHSMATIASYSILDAMRADAANARAGVYNTKTPITPSPCPTPTTSAALSDAQLGQWCNQLGSTLGATASTKGEVNCTATGDCTITITFDDSRSGAGGINDQKVTTRAML